MLKFHLGEQISYKLLAFHGKRKTAHYEAEPTVRVAMRISSETFIPKDF
jgi:hypothetical protein